MKKREKKILSLAIKKLNRIERLADHATMTRDDEGDIGNLAYLVRRKLEKLLNNEISDSE